MFRIHFAPIYHDWLDKGCPTLHPKCYIPSLYKGVLIVDTNCRHNGECAPESWQRQLFEKAEILTRLRPTSVFTALQRDESARQEAEISGRSRQGTKG
jgi:hypothetical protein